MDEKTGKSYLFFLIENEIIKGVGNRNAFLFFVKKKKKCIKVFGSRTQYDWGIGFFEIGK